MGRNVVVADFEVLQVGDELHGYFHSSQGRVGNAHVHQVESPLLLILELIDLFDNCFDFPSPHFQPTFLFLLFLNFFFVDDCRLCSQSGVGPLLINRYSLFSLLILIDRFIILFFRILLVD